MGVEREIERGQQCLLINLLSMNDNGKEED